MYRETLKKILINGKIHHSYEQKDLILQKFEVSPNLAMKSIPLPSIFQQGSSWNIETEELFIKCIRNNTGSERKTTAFLKKENNDNRTYYEVKIIKTR